MQVTRILSFFHDVLHLCETKFQLPVAHLSDGPRRRLVVMGDSARIQDETTENSAWLFALKPFPNKFWTLPN